MKLLGFLSCVFSYSIVLGITNVAIAQVVPDNSLGSRVSPTGVIDGGTTRGTNLFHSFEQFSIPTGGQAYFNNSLDIRNIFARITGQSPSSIDGLLRSNGTADLFLLNPNGIFFGPNAQLNLGGSFFATTANKVDFADGSQFPSTLSGNTVLTSSVPVGLGFLNPGPIRVEGTGHQQRILSVGGGFTATILLTGQGQNPTGLRVAPQETIALLGGSVDFQGGVVTAPSGRIEVGSIRSGTATLNPVPAGYSVTYPGNLDFGAITLSRQSALDATGDRFSSIHLQGSNIQLTDASLLTISNLGSGSVGDIRLDATQSIELIGVTPINQQERLPLVERIKRSIISDTRFGQGADIFLNAPRVIVDESSFISSLTFGSGRSGDIRINAGELTIQDISPNETSGLASGIASGTYGEGRGGDILIQSRQLRILNSASITSTTYRQGRAGDIVVDSSAIEILGGLPILVFDVIPRPTATLSFTSSAITSQSVSTGATGNITINTDRLRVMDGANLATLAGGFGLAGDLTVNATESVEVRGTAVLDPSILPIFLTPQALSFFQALGISPDSVAIDEPSPSAVGSGAGVVNVFASTTLNSPGNPVSQAGSTTIRTGRLTVDDALITVQNTGRGDAGILRVDANEVRLTNRGAVTAETFSGNGGNIVFDVADLVTLNNGSISTSARDIGDGGNINIDTTFVVLANGSRISANAEQGTGGRVRINATGIFSSFDSAITATSALGPEFAGTIELITPKIDPTTGTTPEAPPLTTPAITSGCAGQPQVGQSSFVVSGTGGIPDSPDNIRSSQQGWMNPSPSEVSDTAPGQTNTVIEAQGWMQNPDGTLRFVAVANTPILSASALVHPCGATPQ